jgi:hypothetical protein
VAGIVLGQIAFVSAAQASWSDCPFQFVCLYDGNSSSARLGLPFVKNPGVCYNLPSNQADKADSVVNRVDGSTRTNHANHIQVYRDVNCTGLINITTTYGPNPIPSPGSTNFSAGPIIDERNRASSVFFNTG